MTVLVFVLVVVLVAALLIYLVDLGKVPDPINRVVKIVIVLIAIVIILQKAGIV